jgi:hypothetical protein
MTTVNTNDPVAWTEHLVSEALAPYFSGKKGAERHKNATASVLQSIMHLIKTEVTRNKNRLGATVMTEGASMRHPETNEHFQPPRNL